MTGETDMKNYLNDFYGEFDYPLEARDALNTAYLAIESDEKALELLNKILDGYTATRTVNESEMISACDEIAELTGVSEMTVKLLALICLSRPLRAYYAEKGLEDALWYSAMSDLKWKLIECHIVKGVWGTFVAGWGWFSRWYDITRFALGRLQFEDDPATVGFEKNGIKLNPGDWVIGMHIPSCGKLTKEACMDSLRQASEFYADRFPDGIVKFQCHSWLLAPNHKDYLAPETGIRQFADLFSIANVEENPTGPDLWRIFNRDYEGSTEGFPADTSLQRAYLKMLADGNVPQAALGFIFMKDGEIL
jgi:hypothetical protein